jgi:hypothetical protein
MRELKMLLNLLLLGIFIGRAYSELELRLKRNSRRALIR